MVYTERAEKAAVSRDASQVKNKQTKTVLQVHLFGGYSKRAIESVEEWRGEWGKQTGSMNGEPQVRGCYNITFIYTNKETV